MSLDVHRLVGLSRVSGFDVHPDGSWLAVEVARADDEAARYRSTLQRVPTGGEAEPIGAGAFHDTAPHFRADGVLLFLSDRTDPSHAEEDKADKDTMRQVWARHPDGRLEQLTDEPLGVSSFKVTVNCRLILVSSVLPGVAHETQRATALDRKKHGPSMLHYRQMPVRFWDHWLGDARPHLVQLDPDGTRVDLTPDADREYDVGVDYDLSGDGSTLVCTRRRTSRLRIPLSALEVFDLTAGTRKIFGLDPDLTHYAPRISPDGSAVVSGVCQMDESGIGRHLLRRFELSSGESRMLTTHWDRWPNPVVWLDDERILTGADVEGSAPLFAVNAQDGAVQRLTPGGGSHSAATVRGEWIYAIRDGLLEAPDVVSLPIGGGEATHQTSLSGVSHAELAAAATVEQIEVPSTDGVPIPVFIVKPRNASGPLPLLLWIHGGPRSQWGETWHWRWNSLVAANAGYMVALPNPRGSTGLGQAFADGIGGNTWGEQCYQDVMAAADALVARDDVDASRTCAMGGSFGGYMTNWIGTQTDRFRCLITHASLYSFHQFGWTTDNPAWWQLEFGGGPWGDRERYERYSPDLQLPNWKTPVLVIHGEKDYRVPIGESLALFEGLQQHGVDSELAVFPDENHWVLKPRNAVAWYELVFDFLDRKLGS